MKESLCCGIPALLAAVLLGPVQALAQMQASAIAPQEGDARSVLEEATLRRRHVQPRSDAWLGSPRMVLTAFPGGALPPIYIAPPIRLNPGLPTLPSLPRVEPRLQPVDPQPAFPGQPKKKIEPRRGADEPERENSPEIPGIELPKPSEDPPSVRIDEVQAPLPQQGARVDVVPGVFWYFAYVSVSNENVLFTRVRSNWERLNGSWSPKAWLMRRKQKERWEELSSRQQGLRSWALRLDESWGAQNIEKRAEVFGEDYRRYASDVGDFNSEAATLSAACSGLPPETFYGSGCDVRVAGLESRRQELMERAGDLNSAWKGIADDIRAEQASWQDYNAKVSGWQEDLMRFNVLLKSETDSKECTPCSPYPAGTIGFIGPHTDHAHMGLVPHLNLFRVNQSPSDCSCHWNKNNPDYAAPPPPPDWVDLNPGFPTLVDGEKI